MQLVGLNVPAALEVKLTDPVGVTAPVPEESETVAVQEVGWPTVMVDGMHETLVVVDRDVDVTVNEALTEPAWTLSPP